MAAPDILKGLAKLLLEPANIDTTLSMLNERHEKFVNEKDHVKALHAAQLIGAVEKVRTKQQVKKQ